ncbi:MAG: ABC transporter ATP-binding protein [Endomicrobia bacterium]|nr:ABC transporter ATP-binding protein [Endomicrobiia bacterium]
MTDNTTNKIIELKNISAGYHKTEILKNIGLDISVNSFTGIIGRNGAGKSTLLKVLCGLLKPFSGHILLNEHDVYTLSKKILSKTVSFMPQNVETAFPFTVEEFVMLGRYPYMNIFKIPSESDYKAVEEVLKFTGTDIFAKRYVNELSGGEKQRVLIAQTIAQETDIIIFDEPTSHLDIGSQTNILNLLRILNKKRGKTVIVTLHDLNAAGEFCDTLILLEKGSIRNIGAPEKVLNYKDIEQVYKTTVVVKTNPMSGKPYVIPITAGNRE